MVAFVLWSHFTSSTAHKVGNNAYGVLFFGQKFASYNFGGRNMQLSDNATVVFHGFLNLPNLEKLTIVEAINDYFDSNDREPIRAENAVDFKETSISSPNWQCVCCGR